MTYFTKIPSWAYEVFWGRLTKVSSFFLCQFSEIFRAFLASFRFSRNFLCATVTHVVSHSFSLIQNRTVDYCARNAHLTQSFASVNAKHCNRQRKALQQPTQSFAIANAKLCICQCKALHKRCLHNQKWNLFLIYSDYLLAEHTLTSTRCKRRSVIYPAVIYAFALTARP